MKWNAVYFEENSREKVAEWPLEVKKELGSVLTLLQKGEHVGMPDVRAMPSVAKRVSEIRIKDTTGAYRVFFFLETEVGVLVFHAFKKKTQRTPQKEIDLAKRRLKSLKEELGL